MLLNPKAQLCGIVKLSKYTQQLQKNDRTKPQTSQHCFFLKMPKIALELCSAFNEDKREMSQIIHCTGHSKTT